MSFTYTKNIPDGPHNPSNDWSPMQQNTNSISDAMVRDHFGFNNTNCGLHQQSTYPAGSKPTTAANQGAVYTKTINGNTQLFYTFDNTATEYQLTTNKATIANVNGTDSITIYSVLPNGLTVITGYATNGKDGSTIDLSGTFSNFVSVQLTALGVSSNGTNRALVANPRTVAPAAGTMVINLQDVNNGDQTSARSVYFYVLAQ